MILRRVIEHVRSQSWFAVGLDLAVVITGVFLGLQVTEWNNEREQRASELEYIQRLLGELYDDQDGIQNEIRDLEKKEASLLRLHAAFRSTPDQVPEPMQFLVDVVEGANRGWNQWDTRRATFDELIGSGQLNLIRDSNLRGGIAAYYQFSASTSNRVDERETQFPHISYRVIARSNEAARTFEAPSEVDLLGVSGSEAISEVFASELRDHVVAELSFARFVRDIDIVMLDQVNNLIGRLETYIEQSD